MPEVTTRSPIHHWLKQRTSEWKNVNGTLVAVRLGNADDEKTALERLALCDVSGLQKLGFKGPDAEHFVAEHGIAIPEAVYESRALTDGGLIVRLAADEFLLESGLIGAALPQLSSDLDSAEGQVFRVERQDATFLLTGSRATKVLAQSCSINFNEASLNQLLLTRVAGVNCGVLPETIGNQQFFRLWVDYTYAIYLWTTLVQIFEDLDGSVVGAGCIFPELR